MRLAAAPVVFWLNKTAAKINKQFLKAIFFDALCAVIGRPVLFVACYFFGYSHAARQCFAAVRVTLAFDGEFDGVHVLAFALPRLKIRASAMRTVAVMHGVFTIAALAWNFP